MVLRHGGREQQGLALERRLVDDLQDVAGEAHVEHAVGFVEHEDLDLVEADLALLHEIEQAAGRGDENVDAIGKRLDLRHLADAAEDHGAAEAICTP